VSSPGVSGRAFFNVHPWRLGVALVIAQESHRQAINVAAGFHRCASFRAAGRSARDLLLVISRPAHSATEGAQDIKQAFSKLDAGAERVFWQNHEFSTV
jgi:hypothetical protein